MASRTLLNPRRWLLPALALGLAGCASGPSQDTAWQAEARQVAASVPPRLLTGLQAEGARTEAAA